MAIDYDTLLNDPVILTHGTVASVKTVASLGGGLEFNVTGVFSDDYYEAEVGPGLESHAYRFQYKLGDYSPEHDDRLMINSVNYKISSVQTEPESGWVNLVLRKA